MSPAATGRDGGAPPVFVFDLARALAALAVLAAHARGFVFADLPAQPALPPAGRLFFALTALGHQAVIVFLVLSGTLVTGSVLAAFDRGRWSASDFAATRLNRLWVVLLPCLALGGLEDAAGILIRAPQGPGGYGAAASAQIVLDHLDPLTLAGNALFLQGIAVPVFGSNLPLWTLSVEAWCYAGLLAVAMLWNGRASPMRLAMTAGPIAVAAAVLLPPAFWIIMPIWAMGGALAFWLRARRTDGTAAVCRPGRRKSLAPAAVVLAAAVLSARGLAARHLALSDYLLAAVVAAVFATLRDWRPRTVVPGHAVQAAAAFSYTLYLAHFPLLSLLAAAVLHQERLPWSGSAVLLWLAAMATALLQAGALWWLFERHTGRLRRLWGRQPAPAPLPPHVGREVVLS